MVVVVRPVNIAGDAPHKRLRLAHLLGAEFGAREIVHAVIEAPVDEGGVHAEKVFHLKAGRSGQRHLGF